MAKFAGSVVDTGITIGAITCEYLRKFRKKFEINLLLFSGAWGKMIHVKNLNEKIDGHCPFDRFFVGKNNANAAKMFTVHACFLTALLAINFTS
jgi:hypothetical protein